MQSTLPDQVARDRFKNEVHRNFSVMAAAGAGKTTAIVNRIVRLALKDKANKNPVLPRLVVVTYTRKAALEMQDRARQALIKANAKTEVMAQLRKTFFGTIHSFCHDLVRQHSFALGITSTLEMGENNDTLWREFMQEAGRPSAIPETLWNAVLRHVRFSELLELARTIPALPATASATLGLPPVIDGTALLQFPPNKRSHGSVEEAQKLFRNWMASYQSGSRFLPLPKYDKGGKAFQEVWETTFTPLHQWLNQATAAVAQALAQAYREYRLSHGQAVFEDLLDLAVRLVRDPEHGKKLRELELVILLDEAQDTDPRQFMILTELARAATVQDIWLENGTQPPEPGRFSMVGDPQQSIYSDRADNEYYLDVHARLSAPNAGEALLFNVTMRCARAIVNGVNEAFPHLFSRHCGRGRGTYNPLVAKPGAEEGTLIKLTLMPESDPDDTHGPALLAAHALAAWMKTRRPEHFQAENWSQVAILCPRNEWLQLIARALESVHIETHVLSVSSVRGDDPVFAWVSGLFAVLANPVDAFEITGVLRELFGISDHAIAEYVQTRRTSGTWHPLQLLDPADDTEIVGIALNFLRTLRLEIVNLPLHTAVERALQATQIGLRIGSLGLVSKTAIDDSLDAIRSRSIDAELNRETLFDFATALCRDFSSKYEPATAPRDAIALLSCQKAKGLEWQAVIVPFLGHGIGFPPKEFPRFYHDYGRSAPRVFIRGTNDDAFRERMRQKLDEELDRILYVAMTRAKKLLVLVDDHALHPVPKDLKQTFYKRLQLGVGEANHNWWSRLGTELPLPMDRRLAYGDLWAEGVGDEVHEIPFDAILHSAHVNQGARWDRVLPSSLAIHDHTAAPDGETLQAGDFPEELGTVDPKVYGIWYHAVMEHLPWADGLDACRASVQATIAAAPGEERGVRELPRFIESELARKLCSPDWIVCTEVPLFWRSGDRRVVEGIIDLLARRTDGSSWLLVDWKTDQIRSADPARELVERYAPQIGLYAEALESITGKPVEAVIYGTALGVSLAVK
ncbi:MAG: UvrD-helicase domain-containing protein [Verrucomicrobiota bacterium]|nr:UvrD-helicase domain-containing protein [Verrucomicrobiota bacterium]